MSSRSRSAAACSLLGRAGLARAASARHAASASPAAAETADGVRLSVLQPGPHRRRAVRNPYENNAYAISEGKRCSAVNCAGCHANGGGGMGPPLMDDKWIYGSEPENIYATIVQGRPNGMPSFGGKIRDGRSGSSWRTSAR